MENTIDGKAFAAKLRSEVADKVAKLKSQHNIVPGLAVVLVGEDPASQVYVRNKGKQTVEVGMQSFEHKLPDTTSQKELMQLIDQLNADDSVHGILVQLPLPDQIEEEDGLMYCPVEVFQQQCETAHSVPSSPPGASSQLILPTSPLDMVKGRVDGDR